MPSDTSPKISLSDWLKQSGTAFDVVVGPTDQFPNGAVFVDQKVRDQAFEHAFPERFGVFAFEAAIPVLRKIALRYAKRLAQAESTRLDVSVNGLTHAWYHTIYTELTTLIPTRYLAKRLHRTNKNGLFVVDLGADTLDALNYWRSNPLEPLFLAAELRRLGARVCLRVDNLEKPTLHIGLSSQWRRKWQSQFRRDGASSQMMCKKHIRREAFVADLAGVSRPVRPGFFAQMRARKVGRGRAISLALQENPGFNGLRVLSAPPEIPSLLDGFLQLMAPPTTFLRDWYRKSLRKRDVRVAHVADHASLEGGLLAAEVLRMGGEVHLWPHSANVVDVDVHAPEDIAQVTLAARSTAAVWARTFGTDKVSVDIRTVLPETPKAPAFDPAHPIHVVLFGGAHVLQRVPFYGLAAHKSSWEVVLAGLQASSLDLTIKHKSAWETRDWIRQRAGQSADLQFSRTHANALSLPNMVFMSISLTSTALFEGIARGIPGVVVRDVPVRETPHYDPDYVPCLASDKVVAFLESLNSKEAWERLRDRQLDWFARETVSSPVSLD